jgi:hypothetical protein
MDVVNCYQHDLESLFYVFVWICSLFDAPGTARVDGRHFDKTEKHSLIILKWNEDKEPREIGEIKRSHLSYGGRKLAACFSDYFADLRPFCIELFNALFPMGSNARSDYHASLSPVNYDQIIVIFEKALEHVVGKEEDVPSDDLGDGSPSALSQTPTARKRLFSDIIGGDYFIQPCPTPACPEAILDVFTSTPLPYSVPLEPDLVPPFVRPRRKRARID